MAAAPDFSRCASCGMPLDAAGPAGLCPACLMKLGFAPVVARTILGTDPGDTSNHGADTSAIPASAALSVPPPRIGPYRLVRLLGEGGMGVVYLAEQDEPIRRTVALKLIKLGMDTAEVVGRFETERQALALMDHPNIAHVYDAGATVEGRPYFVMEYVPGVPITEYCDRQAFTTRQRVELFIDVCGAMQHAHQKGIIHRDLKPSNILVTEQDGRPVPKVIDFGIAKATNQHVAEMTVFTQHGRLVGTPEYMSPEQADSGQGDVDTRTDIYAMGVILYELLVGELPFAPERLRQAAYTELLRILREEEPPRPSRRITGASGVDGETATKRRTTSPGLASELRGDLDWIALKALEKDRARRYASASEFAADLTRSLANEPVAARPPSLGYRATKFVRRNRVVVAAAAVILLAIVGGLVASTTMYVRAERARHDADAQRAEAVAQRREADSQRGDALARRLEAEQQSARADAARVDADAQRATAAGALAALERDFYFNNISLAAREWEAGNIGAVERLLRDAPAAHRDWEWRFLSNISRMDSSSFATGLEIQGLAFTGDGRLVIVNAEDHIFSLAPGAWSCGTDPGTRSASTRPPYDAERSIELWDGSSGRRVHRQSYGTDQGMHGRPFVSDDGRWVITRGRAQGIDVWAASGQRLATLEHAERVVGFGAVSPDGSLVAAALAGSPPAAAPDTGTIVVWETGSRRPLREIAVPDRYLSSLEFLPGGQRITVLGARGVYVASVVTGEVLQMMHLDGLVTTSLTVVSTPRLRVMNLNRQPQRVVLDRDGQPRGALMLRAGVPLGLRFLSSDGHERWSWQPAVTQEIRSHAISRDGSTLALALKDCSIRIVDVDTGRHRSTLRGSVTGVNHLAFSDDGRRLASAEASGRVRFWNVPAHHEPRLVADRTNGTGRQITAFSPNHERVLFSSGGSGYRSATLTGGGSSPSWVHSRPQQSRPGTNMRELVVPSYSPAGDRIQIPWMLYGERPDGTLVGTYRISVLDADGGAVLQTLGPPAPDVPIVGPPRVGSGQETRSGARLYKELRLVAWSRDGRRLLVGHAGMRSETGTDVTADPACQTHVWDVASGNLLAQSDSPAAEGQLCSAGAFVDDRRTALQFVLQGPFDRPRTTPRVIDYLTGHVLWQRPEVVVENANPLLTIGRSRAALKVNEQFVMLLDLGTGTTLATLGPLRAQVAGAAFHPRAARIATVDAEHRVQVWDTSTGRELLVMSAEPGAYESESWQVTPRSPSTIATRPAIRFTDDGEQLVLTTVTRLPDGTHLIERRTWSGAPRTRADGRPVAYPDS
jgi:serine/threonine protein kinase/WD40 repeat protein